MIRSTAVKLLTLASLSCFGASCTVAQFANLGPESHFVLPNSNVTPLGPVKASRRSGFAIFGIPDIMSAERTLELYNQALRQNAQANVIIDYARITHVKYFPFLIYIPIFWVVEELEGTAAKMEVGEQIIR